MLRAADHARQKDDLALAPFIGIGCPGRSTPTAPSTAAPRTCRATGKAPGSTCRRACSKAIPKIGDHDTTILMHNDAVVQGLSEVPFMQDVERWAVFTIGTGLGNARFINRGQ